MDIAAVGPLVGLLQVLEKDLNNAIALMCNARQMRRRAECLQLLNWMEHMRFDASSGNMKEDIRQWTSVVDSLSPDVSVKYNGVTGLPSKFSANACICCWTPPYCKDMKLYPSDAVWHVAKVYPVLADAEFHIL